MNAIWDPFQCEVLAELGHTAYVAALSDDPMFDALLQAVGRDRSSGDAAVLLRACPNPATLRGNAAAKRALWPQLRGLRRSPA
ncbi:MAG: hypothetical protein ABIR05_02955 [Luteimonas sp.]